MEVHSLLMSTRSWSIGPSGRAAMPDEARFFEAVEGWPEEERQAAISHIDGGFLQSERGELIDSVQARRKIQELKNNWRQERSATR